MTGINLSIIRDPEARRLLAEIRDTLRDMGDKIEAVLKAGAEPPPIRTGGPWDGRAIPACNCEQENCTCSRE